VFGEEGKPSWAESHPWVMLGNLGKRHGFAWGGDWKGFPDRPHFEMTLGYSLKDFQNKKIDYNKFS
jgi:peptidoglycan L-alanyl-D-glutamate endopeptidase CwlK